MNGSAIVVSVFLLLVLPSPGLAAVIYEELTNLDDLPIDPPYPVLALSPGTNSVIGGTSFSADAVDSFAFSVPAGLQLASITYVFTTSAFARGGASLTQAVSGFDLVTGDGSLPQPGSLLANENVDMVPALCSPFGMTCGPSSPSAVTVPLFEDALPLGAGVFSLEQRALTGNDPELVNWTSSYRIDLVVAPEPGRRLLLASGAAALAWLAHRSRRAAR